MKSQRRKGVCTSEARRKLEAGSGAGARRPRRFAGGCAGRLTYRVPGEVDGVTYTLTVFNAGPSDDPGALVEDIFHSDLGDITWE